MHQQHSNKGSTSGNQIAYQPFSNEEISPNSADWNSPGVIQQGIPVSGGPLMSYPAPMSHFEVANSPVTVTSQNDPAYAKLETWPYLVYKYWILLGISVNLMITIRIGLRLGFSEEFAWDLVVFGIHVWNATQLIFVFEAISKRSEAKIDKALKFMKIFAFLFWIFVFVHSGRMISGNAFGRFLQDDQSDHSDRSDDNDDNRRDQDGRGDHHRGREHHGRDRDNNWDNNDDNQEGWQAGGFFACETEICRVKFLISSILLASVAVGMFYIFFWYGARKVKQILASPRLSQNQRNQQVQRA